MSLFACGEQYSLIVANIPGVDERIILASGINLHGELGIKLQERNINEFTVVPGLSHIKQVSCGTSTSLALNDQGEIYIWGNIYIGHLGAVRQQSAIPVKINIPVSIATISAGIDFSSFVDINGKVWCWGEKIARYLDPNYKYMSRYDPIEPAMILGLNNITYLSSGVKALLALDNEDNVWSVNFESNDAPAVVLNNASAISAFGNSFAAIDLDRNLIVWGSNRFGELGMPVRVPGRLGPRVGELFPTILMNDIISLSVGNGPLYVIDSNNDLIRVSEYFYGEIEHDREQLTYQPKSLPHIGKVIAISSSHTHRIAQTQAGNLITWGLNTDGQLGTGNNVSTNVPQPITYRPASLGMSRIKNARYPQ